MSRFATLLVIVCIAGITAFSGCNCRPDIESVTSIDFFVSSVHSSSQTLDIEIFLRPRDSEGRVVEAPGNLDAELWRQNPSTNKKVDLLLEWTGIQVTPESYERNSGAWIWLHYSKEQESYAGFFQSAILGIGYICYFQPIYIMEKAYNAKPELFILEIAFMLDTKTLVCTKTDLDIGIIEIGVPKYY